MTTMTRPRASSRRRKAPPPSEWWPPEWGPAPKYATRRSPELASWGPKAGQAAEILGRPFFPFQQFIADVALEVQEDGRWRYDEVYLLLPRRSGKTFMQQAVVETIAESKPAMIAMTAQTRDKAKDRWKDVCSNPRTPGYAAIPFMQKRVKVTTGVGNERCIWHANGSEFVPFAPNEDAGHGEQFDLVFVDELWAFDLEEKRLLETGYKPSAIIGDLQVWHMSAAGTSRSMWLKEAREKGRKAVNNPASRIAYFEWGISEDEARLDGEALADALWRNHPRCWIDLRREVLVEEVENRSKAEVLRDYGNIDADGTAEMCVPVSLFDARKAAQKIPFGSQVWVGVAHADDRKESAVVAAWRRPDGVVQSDTVIRATGVKWAEEYVASMPDVAGVAVVNYRMGRQLADRLDGLEEPPAVLRLSGPDFSAACQEWMAAMTETGTGDGLAHDGSRDLIDALTNAELHDKQGWRSRTGEPITTVVAHTLARHGVLNAPETADDTPAEFWIY